ncbi:MAG: SpoIIE family protein phosphatase [Leptonema sp. (in: Bacteria)]|nr:SpoIIE family protein phosphatase [Leptonema sp. (in: bacteria)]
MKSSRFLVISVWFIFSVVFQFPVFAEKTNLWLPEACSITDKIGRSSQSLFRCAVYYEDQDRKLAFTTVDEQWQKFKPFQKDNQSAGYTKSAYWVRLHIQNQESKRFTGIMLVAPQGCDHIGVRLVFSDGQIREFELGDSLPYDIREIASRLQGFRLELQPQEIVDITLRYQTTNGLRFPLQLYSDQSFERHSVNERMLFGVYFGILVVMVIYNLSLFIAIRDTVSIDYIVFLVSFAFGILSLTGFGFEYLWPYATYFTHRAHPIFMSISLFFGIRFIQSYVHSATIEKYTDKFLTLLRYFTLFIAIAALGPFVRQVSVLLQLVVMISVPTVLFIGIYGTILKRSGAAYLLLAWILLLVGALLYALASIGLLPYNLFTSNMLLLGSAADMLIFSLGLGERYGQLRLQNHEFEMQLEIARNMQKSLLPVIPETIRSTQLHYIYRPMQLVGGDFVDVMKRDDELGLFICDVSGHGIGASLLSSMVKMSLSTYWHDCITEPDELLRKMHKSLLDKFGDQYLTACAVSINQKTGLLRYARAGHEEPIIVRSNGQIEYLDSPGTILHSMLMMPIHTSELQLNKGDSLLLFTDGLSQAMNKRMQQFGDSRLVELLKYYHNESPVELCNRIKKSLDKFIANELQDDLALMIYKFT